jgi:hypothetical protein
MANLSRTASGDVPSSRWPLTNFFDHEGADILMIGAPQNVVEERGVDLAPEQEAEATPHCSADLKIEQSVHPPEAALQRRLG